MINDKLKKAIEVIKKPTIVIVKYLIVTVAVVSSFYLGKFIENRESRKESKSINVIKKGEVNIAIDEGNNLLIIDHKTGDYMLLEDSIGNSIFRLYSRNIWAKNSDNE